MVRGLRSQVCVYIEEFSALPALLCMHRHAACLSTLCHIRTQLAQHPRECSAVSLGDASEFSQLPIPDALSSRYASHDVDDAVLPIVAHGGNRCRSLADRIAYPQHAALQHPRQRAAAALQGLDDAWLALLQAGAGLALKGDPQHHFRADLQQGAGGKACRRPIDEQVFAQCERWHLEIAIHVGPSQQDLAWRKPLGMPVAKQSLIGHGSGFSDGLGFQSGWTVQIQSLQGAHGPPGQEWGKQHGESTRGIRDWHLGRMAMGWSDVRGGFPGAWQKFHAGVDAGAIPTTWLQPAQQTGPPTRP